jgi:hypothetical protein
VILDPVYSGKAVYHMVQQMRDDPGAWRGKVRPSHQEAEEHQCGWYATVEDFQGGVVSLTW